MFTEFHKLNLFSFSIGKYGSNDEDFFLYIMEKSCGYLSYYSDYSRLLSYHSDYSRLLSYHSDYSRPLSYNADYLVTSLDYSRPL